MSTRIDLNPSDVTVFCHAGRVLASFSLENFGSFADEAELDLRAVGRSPAGATAWDGRLTTVAAIYGANASGKSTVFRAFHAFQRLVENSYRFGVVSAEPFRLAPEYANRPTRLSATFVADDGVCYSYGFGVQGGVVVEEWAERYATARSTLLFERKGMTFSYGAALTGRKRSVEHTVSESTLLLSAAAAARFTPLMPLYRWIVDGLRCYSAGGYHQIYEHLFEQLERDPDALKRVSGMLREADLGLAELELNRRPLTDPELAIARQQQAFLRSREGRDLPLPTEIVEARMHHRSASGAVPLSFEQESDGTRAMLCHAFVIDQALRSGRTMVFDEIDASLHPLLVAGIVRTFKDRGINPHQSQFIFTTHDVSLIEPSSPGGAAIERDEMWVTEKDHTGRSRLISVADYSPRASDNLRRRYVTGRYGGIPENVDFSPLGQSAQGA